MRLLVTLGLAAVVGGCGSTPPPTPDGGMADVGMPRPPCGVTLNPGGPIRVRTNERVTLSAAVLPTAPLTEVRFGLVGDARDASLTATRALTDARGETSLEFIAPSSPSSFRIRASVQCGSESYVDVSVGDRGFGTISVVADYRGVRQPSHIAVSLFRGGDCATLPAEADREVQLPPQGGTVSFGTLPAGVSYTVRAVAIGASALALSSACAAPLPVETDETTEARLLFADVPLRIGALYDLSMRYDLSALAAGSAARWRAAAADEVMRSGGDGTLLGAELSEAVADAAPPADRDAARMMFEQLLQDRLSAEITTVLAAGRISLTDVFRELSDRVAEVLASTRATCVLRATAMGDRDVPVRVERVEYTLDPNTPDVSRDDVVVPVIETSVGRLRFGLGDSVDVSLASFPMPYSRLELNSLGALLGRVGVSSSGEYAAFIVCPTVVRLMRDQHTVCDDACVAAACRRAIGRVGALYEVAVMSDGSSRAAMDAGFSGTSRTAPGGLVVQQVSGPARGVFVDEPAATLSAVATLTSRAEGS